MSTGAWILRGPGTLSRCSASRPKARDEVQVGVCPPDIRARSGGHGLLPGDTAGTASCSLERVEYRKEIPTSMRCRSPRRPAVTPTRWFRRDSKRLSNSRKENRWTVGRSEQPSRDCRT